MRSAPAQPSPAFCGARGLNGGDAELVASLDADAVRAAGWHTAMAAEIKTERATRRAPTIHPATSERLRFDRFRAANPF